MFEEKAKSLVNEMITNNRKAGPESSNKDEFKSVQKQKAKITEKLSLIITDMRAKADENQNASKQQPANLDVSNGDKKRSQSRNETSENINSMQVPRMKT